MPEFKRYATGGSCCRLDLVERDGVLCVAKRVRRDVEGVENGCAKLMSEIRHMKDYESFGLFPRIYESGFAGEEYFAIMERCFDGATLSDLIRNAFVPERVFEESFEMIMRSLLKRLYSRRYATPPDPDYLARHYYDRAIRRTKMVYENGMLEKYGFSDLLKKASLNGCVINGEYYPSVFEYVDFMRRNRELNDALAVHFVCHSHHDLCPMNIVIDYDVGAEKTRDFRLIDVRGESETGVGARHYMYDMGKALFGLDSFDLFRVFNGRVDAASYEAEIRDGERPQIEFAFLPRGIASRSRNAVRAFWRFFERNDFFSETLGDSPERLRWKFLFSQSFMFHPDVPCRILKDHDEEEAVLMHARGLVLMRRFLETFFGRDPVGKFRTRVDVWKGLE